MDSENQEAEDYFAALAGRRPGSTGPAALRDALLAQKRVLDDADSASLGDLDGTERLRMDGIKRRLEAAGAWRREPSTPQGRLERLRQRLREWTGAGGWQPLLALTVSMVLATLVVFDLAFPVVDTGNSSRTLRGASDDIVTSRDPEAAARTLALRLQNLGADVVLVKINDDEWSLNVDTRDPKVAAVVSIALRDAGFRISGPAPYELSVRRRR